MKVSQLFQKLSSTVIASAAILGFCASTASASIIGDAVTVRFTDFNYFDLTQTVVAQSGIDGYFFGGNVSFDIEDSFVRFTVNGDFCGMTCTMHDASVIFSGLDFGAPISGISLNDGGLGPYGAMYSGDKISFIIPDRALSAGSFAQADVMVNNVPEPTSIALLGLGLLGFAASRRKSTK